MVRKQKAVTFGTRYFDYRDIIRLSIHSKCPLQYTALKNSSFRPSRSALPNALSVGTLCVPISRLASPSSPRGELRLTSGGPK
jgi:hypothetical protein